MNYETVASELLRALRGKRSQTGFSRRLGFRSNVLYAWESGRRFPTAAGLFRVAARGARIDVNAGMERFFRTPPEWLGKADLSTPEGMVQLLDELRAGARINDLTERTGISRFSLSRWFRGRTEPRLPDFLRLVEATSLRLLDFIAALTDPALLPSVARAWQRLEAGRQVAYQVPWSQAVLRALELESYRAGPPHHPGAVADLIGISIEEEERCLRTLEQTGQIRMKAGRWTIDRVLTIDTRRDAAAGLRLKQWWSSVGLQRLQEGAGGQYSYNLFTVSEADWLRIQELHANYFQEMRRIIAASESPERVVLANLHLIPLTQ